MSTLLSSKVSIEEEEPAQRQIEGEATAVTGFVGVTERGPFGATLVSSPEEYQRLFGGYTGSGDVATGVNGFFLNGGTEAWISRVVHYTDATDPTTKTSAKGTLTLAATSGGTLTVTGKTDGAYANAISAKISAATSGEAARFKFQTLKNGVILETFDNLSMDDTDANYVETVINDPTLGSIYVAVTDLDNVGTPPADRPINGTFGPLTGGSDGLGSLADADFVGGTGTNGRVGIRALDTVDALALLTVPGRATSVVHNAMVTYCEVTRNKSVFPILDPPAGTSAAGIVTYVASTASLENSSEFGAIYWPRIKIGNPNTGVYGSGAEITVPPSGYIAGVYARTDAARDGGVYDPPAGIERGIIRGCTGFETDECLEEAKRDLVFPHRINPLTTSKGQPKYIDGARTLKGNGNFPGVAERRGVIFIEQSVKKGIQVARHSNNDEGLRAEAARTVQAFLILQMNNGAFRSKNPKLAFFVDFGEALNTDAVIFAGRLIGRIGLATQKAAEFVILRFSQATKTLDAAAALGKGPHRHARKRQAAKLLQEVQVRGRDRQV